MKNFTLLFLLYSSLAQAQWTSKTSGSTSDFNAVAFKDATSGVAVGLNVIATTADGGETWTSTTITGTFNDVTFSGGDTVIAVANSGVAKVSFDKGANWQAATSANGRTYLSVKCKGGVCYATTSGGYVEKSTDNGVTWTSVAAFSRGWNNIYDIEWFGDTVYLAGSKPAMYAYSYDNGANWTTNTVMAAAYPTANCKGLQFPEGSSKGWFVFQLDKVYKTTSALSSIDTIDLSASFTSPNYLNSTCFTTFNSGFVNGASGIFATTDAGATWTKESSESINHICAVGNTFVGVGGAGKIVKRNAPTTGLSTGQVASFACYPNPAEGVLNFSSVVQSVNVYNANGQLMISAEHTNQVDLSALCSGIYMVRLLVDGQYHNYPIMH